MKIPLSSSIIGRVSACPGRTNCGRNAKKKIVSFGLSRLMSTPVPIPRQGDRGVASASATSELRSRQVITAR